MSLFTPIPVLNLVIIPVVIRATAMWVDCYRDKHAMWKNYLSRRGLCSCLIPSRLPFIPFSI
ncbi:hypothetical protein ACNKHQ_14235 [Shigella flexneri]